MGKLQPDLVLLDLSMPRMRGLEAIPELRKVSPETRILTLTVHDSEEYILASLQAGADGYVLKDATRDELLLAIRSVLSGKSYLSPEVSTKVIDGYLGARGGIKPEASWESLTKREREVLKLVAEGYRNKQVAELLCISVKTVERHRANLMEKLDLHDVSALTAYAMKRGLVTR